MTLSLLAHEELLRAEGELRRELAEARAEVERLQAERAGVVAALDDLRAPSVEDLAAARGPEHGTLREHAGRALTLAERIAAALPPLPEPAGEWLRRGALWRRRLTLDAVMIARDEHKPEVKIDLSEFATVNGDTAAIEVHCIDRLMDALRLALGPAGIPPPTEPKP